MDRDILSLLRTPNPWLERPESYREFAARKIGARFIERVSPEARDWPVPEKAHLVIGGRQVGKSTFLLKRPQLPRSARSFIEAYAPDRFCVLNLALDAREAIGRTEVRGRRRLGPGAA